MFDPKRLNTDEYVRQIIEALDAERPFKAENLLIEYGGKAYELARQDAAEALAKMFPQTANVR